MPRWIKLGQSNARSFAIFGMTADGPIETISLVPFGATAARPTRIDPTDPHNPNRRQQVYESIKPPAPRKMETPPAETVVVIGDSFGEWLAYGLEQVFAETPQIGIVRKVKSDLGLVRDDARLDAPEWTQAIKDLLPATEKANAIVVMLGVNDRSSLRERAPPAKEASSPSDNNHPAPAGAGERGAAPSASFEVFIPTNGPGFIPSASTT